MLFSDAELVVGVVIGSVGVGVVIESVVVGVVVGTCFGPNSVSKV
jgi:hypothetical protein